MNAPNPSGEPVVFRQELSPIHLLERAGEVFADRIAASDGEARYTWREFRARARRLASALRADELRKGDRIAFLPSTRSRSCSPTSPCPWRAGCWWPSTRG